MRLRLRRAGRPPLAWGPRLSHVVILGCAAALLTACLVTGERSLGDGPARSEATERGAGDGAWRVVVAIDGRPGRPEPEAVYGVVSGTVGPNPEVVFRIAPSLGRFHSAVVTVREVHREVVALDGTFISDLTADELAKFRPGRPFRLFSPGLEIVGGAPADREARRLRSDQSYQLDLVVQGSRGYATVRVRFRTRHDTDWESR